MKRIIKDYKTICPELLQELYKRYPDGIDERDLISYTTSNGVKIQAVELHTQDTIYLIKMSSELVARMESFSDDDDGLDAYSDGYRERN